MAGQPSCLSDRSQRWGGGYCGARLARCWPGPACRAWSARRAFRRGARKSRDAPRRHARPGGRGAGVLIHTRRAGWAKRSSLPYHSRTGQRTALRSMSHSPIQETLSQPPPLVPARSPSRTVSANADVYRWSSSSSRSREHSTSSNADSTPELPGSRASSASGSNPAANAAACLVSGTDPHPGNERIVTCAGQRVRARPRPAGGAARRAEPPLDQRRVHWISPAPSVSYGSSRDG
jgi:hypothetical protein